MIRKCHNEKDNHFAYLMGSYLHSHGTKTEVIRMMNKLCLSVSPSSIQRWNSIMYQKLTKENENVHTFSLFSLFSLSLSLFFYKSFFLLIKKSQKLHKGSNYFYVIDNINKTAIKRHHSIDIKNSQITGTMRASIKFREIELPESLVVGPREYSVSFMTIFINLFNTYFNS